MSAEIYTDISEPVETPAAQELSDRSIYILDTIDERTVGYVDHKLRELLSESQTEPINVMICSGGGVVYAGLAIYDMLVAAPAPIITIVSGFAMSAGLLVSIAGDIRIAYPHARMMFHRCIDEVEDDDENKTKRKKRYKEKPWVLKENADIDRLMCQLMEERTSKSRRFWWNRVKNREDFYFDKKTALKLGVLTPVEEE